jgi:tRNAThr (cytosine32-N3)-methyltransferase
MPFAETAAKLPEGIEPHSLDIVVLIFVLSALHPREWEAAVRNVRTALKPGGMVLLRDYGRHDLPQLRFRKGRLLDENFYGEWQRSTAAVIC